MIPPHTVRLEFHSAFDMLDFVQVVSDHIGQLAGLDEDALHWVGVAVRESVINAIKHGNRNDDAQARRSSSSRPVPPTDARRAGRFASTTRARASIPKKSPIRWRPRTSSSRAAAASSSCAASWTTCAAAACPRAAWKSAWSRSSRKAARDAAARRLPDPRFLATAIEAVMRAGELQMATFGTGDPRRQEGRDRSRHRGRPRGRAHVPRADRRALSRSRRARRGVRRRRRAAPRHRWVFDPLDGTTNFAHGLPIFCASLALEIDGEAGGRRRLRPDPPGAVHRRARRRRVAERRSRCASRRRDACSTSLLVTGFPYDVHSDARRARRPVRARSSASARAVRRLGSAALDLCYVAAGRFDGFWESELKPWDTRGGGADRRRRPAAA